MISSLHGLYDDRIYWKEALSLKRNGYDVIHLGVGDEDLDLISEEGIRLMQVKRKKYFGNPYIDIVYKNLSFRPSIYKKLFKICLRLKADVYHFHDVQINRIGPALKKLEHRPEVIYDVHEDYYEQVMVSAPAGIARIFFRIYALCLRRNELRKSRHYDAIITVVPHIAEYFRKVVDPVKVHLIYNFTTMKPGGYLPYEEKTWDAIYSGMINNVRGGMEIIKAAALIKKEIPSVKILLVGPVPDPSYRQRLESLIGEFGLEDNVLLKRSVPYADMESLLQQSRIGLGIFMPVSIFEFGIQVKTFEYMICGLPVVCSNTGNISRIVTENKAGLTVDPHFPVEIAAAITTLIKDHALYNTLRTNAISAANAKYHWGSEEKKLTGIYRTLCPLSNYPI